MGRMMQHPRYNVISMRVSDEELNQLRELAEVTKINVSKLMRAAMHRLAGEYEDYLLKPKQTN